MKKNKKLALLLCIVMGLSVTLAGCGGDKNTSSTDGDDINILASTMRLEAMIDGWNQMIANFEEENEGVKVNLNMEGEWDEIPQKLSQASMAKQQVDFVRTTGGTIRSTMAPAGAVMDITDTMAQFADRFVDGTLKDYDIGGHLFGFPYGETTTSCVYYNKTMFDELNLEEPKTVEDLANCAQVIKEKKGIKNPWIHQGKITDYWQMWFAETYGQVTHHKSVAKVEDWLSGNSSFVNDETVAAFAAIRDLFDRGILTSDSFDTDETAMKALFAKQEAAMFYGGTWEYATALDVVDGAFEIGVFMFPAIDDSMSPYACGAGDDGIAIASNCNKDNWANIVKFIDHMTNEESANLTISPIQPILPVIKTVPQVDLPCAKDLASFVPNTVMFLDWMWPAEINNTMGNQIAGVASGTITPEDAAQAVQDTYDKLVKQDGYNYDWYNKWTDEDWAKVTPPEA